LEIHNKRKALFGKGYLLIKKSSSINSVIIHHLLNVTQGIYDMIPHHIALTI